MLRDAWRLALGTLTALPVKPPALVDPRRAGTAMVLAPLAVVPLALAVAVIIVIGHWVGFSSLVVALLAIAGLALGNRGFHLDGLSDVADGLAASYDRERSLAVMKTGTSGPAGVVAVVLTLGLQVAGLVGVLSHADVWRAAAVAGLAVCVSRLALAVCCVRRVPPARPDGLGTTYTQIVAPGVTAILWLLSATLLALVGRWAGLEWWRGAAACLVALVVVGVVVARAVRRFGGVTGDVFGATVELALTALLVVMS
ncbi:MAG: adenosylcobinamide-GDP ribazoletransferase [Actinomycetota bacterium]|nr:adenosylcobinamide-GDP ribazoletransferase [Actinomycetota bacterium]